METPAEVIARGTGDRLQHVGLTQQHLQTQERKDQGLLEVGENRIHHRLEPQALILHMPGQALHQVCVMHTPSTDQEGGLMIWLTALSKLPMRLVHMTRLGPFLCQHEPQRIGDPQGDVLAQGG